MTRIHWLLVFYYFLINEDSQQRIIEKKLDLSYSIRVDESNERLLDKHKINFSIEPLDIAKEMNREDIGNYVLRTNKKVYYKSLDDIYAYLDHLAGTYHKLIHVETIGTTFENRPIRMVRLSEMHSHGQTILLDSGIFGRDWTSIASVMYFIEQYLLDFDNLLPTIKSKAWLIIPVLNPDGYVHSMKRDKLWQKNRQVTNGQCVGVNIDSNIAFDECKNADFKTQCHPYYCGSGHFSEAESRAFINVVNKSSVEWYVSVRSGGARVVAPSGRTPEYYTDGASTDTYHMFLARDLAMVMSLHDVPYKAESSVSRVDTPGSSASYMARKEGVVAAFIIGTRGGSPALPEAQLQLACYEIYAGLFRFARMVGF